MKDELKAIFIDGTLTIGKPLPDDVPPAKIGEVLLTAGASKDPGIEPATIRLCPNGDIFVNGRLAANDLEVVEGLRAFLKACWVLA